MRLCISLFFVACSSGFQPLKISDTGFSSTDQGSTDTQVDEDNEDANSDGNGNGGGNNPGYENPYNGE